MACSQRALLEVVGALDASYGVDVIRSSVQVMVKVHALVKAFDADIGIPESEVSRMGADLDTEVTGFADVELSVTAFLHVLLDATFSGACICGSQGGKGSRLSTGGRRKILNFRAGDSKDSAQWAADLRSRQVRGLRGTHPVMPNAHVGLEAAMLVVMVGVALQRCLVHFLCNIRVRVPEGSSEMVSVSVRTIFAQRDADHLRDYFDSIAKMCGRECPQVKAMLHTADDGLTAFAAFHVPRWRKIRSTSLLERVNKEIKCLTDVVWVFPNPTALLRLASSVLIETHDERQVADRRYLSEEPITQFNDQTTATPERPASRSATIKALSDFRKEESCGQLTCR